MFAGSISGAHPPSPWLPYAVTLEDDRGNPLRTFHGDGTTFVLGYLGERYNVRISNQSDRRVEAVLTVDGRDAVSGNPGDFVHQRGYIVQPHGSVVVDGFRRSLEQTAAFRFSRPGASYSSRMGTPENVGIIGVAFFAEQRPRPRPPAPAYYPYDDYDARPRAQSKPSTEGSGRSSGADLYSRRDEAPRSAPAPTAGAKRRSSASDDLEYAPRESQRRAPSRLGTEYGESTYSPVTEVPFRRQTTWNPDAVVSLRYDDADGLVARGFDVYPRATWWSERSERVYEPSAFPRNRFAEPPW
jgi:hypothetical protein